MVVGTFFLSFACVRACVCVKQVLKKLLAFRGGPAIFAGDTNLREAEVKQEKLAKEVTVAMRGGR